MKNSPRVAAVSALIGAFLSFPPSSASHADPTHPARRTGISSSGGPAVRGRETTPRLGRPGVAAGRIGLDIHQVSPAVHRMVETRTHRERLVRWWTPARMRRADPLDDLVALQTTRRPVPGGLPSETPASSPSAGAAWTSGGGVARTTGRVFFTYQGRPASCSGNAVTSANQSTVITAGHCVRLDGAWHTDWVFVPGYHDGQAPYGKWTAKRTLTTPQWEAHENLDYDVGAATVDTRDGLTLTGAVGGQGIAFNQRRHRPTYAFGYPAEAPYDGSKLVYCSGTDKDDPGKTHDLGLTCDMTAGSSGGPWFTGFDDRTGTGTQNSVNSFKYNALPNEMFGPYFGTAVQALYDKAQNT